MTAVRMASMKALSLFSGIGGLDLAAESCGIETAAFCEIEPYAVKVLERRFQGIENHGDITRFTNRTLRELGGSPFLRFKCPADYDGTIDVVHGGFPCQDLSVAGKQAGLEGARSGLWFEMLRVISEVRPRFVLAENVRGAVNLALDTVRAGLEGENYEVWPFVVPAAAFGAPHKRERMFVIGIRKDVSDTLDERLQRGERAGALLEQGTPPSQPAAECGEGSLWPTPTTHGNYNRAGVSDKSWNGLSTAVNLWPTPHRNCSNGAGAHGYGGLNLQTAVSLWPTPTVGTSGGGKLCGGTGHLTMLRDALGYEEARKLSAGNGGQLNPEWVEILMGFPIGWTSIDDAVTGQWPGWPALMGEEQHPYEPPRTITKCADRAKRLKCLGNAVVPQQAYPLFRALAYMDEVYNNV